MLGVEVVGTMALSGASSQCFANIICEEAMRVASMDLGMNIWMRLIMFW